MTIGIHAATWENMIFHKPALWLKNHLPIWVHKPLFSCAICMSSVWSVVFWVVFNFHFVLLPFVILATAGLNTIFTGIIAHIIPDENE